MNHDGRKPWTRQLLVGLGALLAVALVIGGVVGAFALGSSTVGSGDSAGGEAEASTSPSGTLTGTATAAPSTEALASEAPASEAPASEPPSPPQERAGGAAITLRAAPASVRANQRINLSGVYPRGAGATLQVQRFEGRWADFPVRVSVDGGRFSSYIQSSRTGSLRFRVVDPAAGRVSNPVRVRIG